MALTNCRECGNQVSTEALSCPHCGVPLKAGLRPTWGYEWKSSLTLFGYPLVHIAIGRNPEVIGPILVPLLIGLGFAEAIAIYALVIAFILVGKV